MQVVKLGTVAIDGTKVQANASRHKAMAAKLGTGEGQAACRKRKWIAEPPNGWIKNELGLRQFSMRGLRRVVRAECKLVCMALNLWRMATLQVG